MEEKIKRKDGKVRLMKCLENLGIILSSSISVQLRHKYNGNIYVFSTETCDRVENVMKRQLLEALDEKIKRDNPDGISSKDFVDEFIRALRETWDEEFKNKLSEIKDAVDMSFAQDRPSMLEIGETKIRLKDFCTFKILNADARVIVGDQDEYEELWD